MYAPFYDEKLAAVNALLDYLSPLEWTVHVREGNEVDGGALAELAARRHGRIAWVSHVAHLDDGRVLADDRYWHGKLIQSRAPSGLWALGGSPNLSARALLRSVPAGGNCELAVLARPSGSLSPPAGEAPPRRTRPRGGCSSPNAATGAPGRLAAAASAGKGGPVLSLGRRRSALAPP